MKIATNGIQFNLVNLTAVAREFGLKFIILHGSRVTGKYRADSDFDIAVVSKNSLPTESKLNLYSKLRNIFNSEEIELDLDIKMLDRADPLFRYQVVRDGKLLYGNLTDYNEYKSVTYRMYDDAKPLFELENILIKKYQKHLEETYVR